MGHANQCRGDKIWVLIALFFALAGAGFGQSLGDAARDNRQKQQAKTSQAPAKKVITNDDIPQTDEPKEKPSPKQVSAGTTGATAAQIEKNGEERKAAIQAQKNIVTSLQHDLDRLNASVHFVEVNRYSNGVEYNQAQLRKQQESARLQKQWDEQKKKLEDMQESARKAGFGSAVYDP